MFVVLQMQFVVDVQLVVWVNYYSGIVELVVFVFGDVGYDMDIVVVCGGYLGLGGGVVGQDFC